MALAHTLIRVYATQPVKWVQQESDMNILSLKGVSTCTCHSCQCEGLTIPYVYFKILGQSVAASKTALVRSDQLSRLSYGKGADELCEASIRPWRFSLANPSVETSDSCQTLSSTDSNPCGGRLLTQDKKWDFPNVWTNWPWSVAKAARI